MKYYRVKFGYRNDEFISVDENELPMAVRSHISGKKGIFREGTISGDKIIAITPDYQRAMGWNRDYQLTGEDYDEIGPSKQREYQNLLQETTYQINNQLSSGTEIKRLS